MQAEAEWGLGGECVGGCLGASQSNPGKAPKLLLISQYCSGSASENPSTLCGELHSCILLQYCSTNTPEL